MNNLNIINNWIFRFLLIGTITEAILFPAWENIVGCVSFLFVWILLKNTIFKKENFETFFLPTFTMYGLAICFHFLPLFATLLEAKPLTFRFEVPFLTFGNQILNMLMLVAAYYICKINYKEDNWLSNLWYRFGFYETPTNSQLWFIGIAGCVGMLAMLFVQGTESGYASNLGIFGHFMQELSKLAPIPICLVFSSFFMNSNNGIKSKKTLFIYFILISLLGVATTQRTTIFTAAGMLAMCYFIKIILDKKTLIKGKNVFIASVVVFLMTGPVADLAVAMSIAREMSYYSNSSSKTFDQVISLYNNKELLHTLYNIQIAEADNGGHNDYGWSEYYVDNVFLDRFCNIRVCDATLYYVTKLGYDNPAMHDYVQKQLLYLVPSPILDAFGFKGSKFGDIYSPGDLISTKSLGYKNQYRGYRVAGDTGIGLYLWGYMYYVYALFIYVVLFFFLASLTRNESYFTLTPYVMLGLILYFWQFNNNSGIMRILNTILRNGWQSVIIYCIVFSFARIVLPRKIV